MTSQPSWQTIVIHILPNISRCKGKQTMKVGQLIEYTWVTSFLKSHMQNVLGELFPEPYLKYQNWVYL